MGIESLRLMLERMSLSRVLRRVEREARHMATAVEARRPLSAFDRRFRLDTFFLGYERLPPDIRSGVSVAVDVGANVGDWTVAAARLLGAKTIFAYEPNPDVFKKFVARIRHRRSVCPRQLAAGDKSGMVSFRCETVPQLSSVLPIQSRWRAEHRLGETRTVEVRQIPLDEDLWQFPQIDIMKIDVQGYEPAVLAGAREALKRTRCLVIEVTYAPDYYEGGAHYRDLLKQLETVYGFELWDINVMRASDGRPAYGDAIMVPSRDRVVGEQVIRPQVPKLGIREVLAQYDDLGNLASERDFGRGAALLSADR